MPQKQTIKAIRKQLSEEGVMKLKPPTDRQYVNYYDTLLPGLILRVNAGGRKAWVVRYYRKVVAKSGKQAGQRISMPTTHKLDRYPILKVKEARERARLFMADPKKAMATADDGSFKGVAETFINLYVDGDKDRDVPLRSKKNILRVLNKYIYPVWGDRLFREITRDNVSDLLDKIQKNNGARQADVALSIIRKMMNWYTTRKGDYTSPVVPGMNRSNTKAHERTRSLDDDEIRALWTACAGLGTFGGLTKMLLLSGQRRDKVATMKWDDLDDGVWRIASAEREKANADRLRLPQPALDIIAAQPRIAGNPFVFAAAVGSKAFNSFSQRKTELDEKLPDDMEPFVLHDLRRTCRQLMSRAGTRQDVGELALGHSIKGIQATYDNRAAYQPAIDQALACVAAEIGKIINPPPSDNVVDFSTAKS